MKSLPVGLEYDSKRAKNSRFKKRKNTKIGFMVKWISQGVAGSHEGKPR